MATAHILVPRSGVRAHTRARWRPSEPLIVFIGLFAIYFAGACFLTLVANVIYGDAFSRVEIAQRILFSRDPHLAAIGFLWNPLPVIALLPVVPFKLIWPQLTMLGLAGGVVSAACMAGAVVQVRGMLVDRGVSRSLVLLLAGAFAFHPLVLFFGANGMSEAMLLLFLLMAVRHLARWLRDSDLVSLINTGIALSLAYLARYEALAAALGVIAIVGVVSLVRCKRKGEPYSTVLLDVAIVAAPVVFAFLVWLLASWVISGQPFERFTSIYENRTRVPTGYMPWSQSLASLTLGQLASLEPLLPLLLVLSLIAKTRRDASLALSSLACAGSTLAFMVLAEESGSIINELRYLIVLVPLTVVLAGAYVVGPTHDRPRPPRLARTISVVCVLCLVAAIPVSARAMFDPRLNPYASAFVQAAFSPSANSVGGRLNWSTERKVAADLDGLHLASGTVLLDDYIGFPIVVSSTNPRQFVITSDRDFQSVLTDPATAGILYVLVPQPGYLGSLDAVNRQYPSFFDDGAGLATLVREYQGQGLNDTTWRLYRVN